MTHVSRNMVDEGTTVVPGIPIPSTDPVFLALVGVHVRFGLAARDLFVLFAPPVTSHPTRLVDRQHDRQEQ